jgi:hypothetical protein
LAKQRDLRLHHCSACGEHCVFMHSYRRLHAKRHRRTSHRGTRKLSRRSLSQRAPIASAPSALRKPCNSGRARRDCRRS